jgi:hypothetical protein
MNACEYCGRVHSLLVPVRLRRLYGEEPVKLCSDCWLDVQSVNTGKRQEA